MHWKTIYPNEEGDWINQRNKTFETFIPIQPDKKYNLKSHSFFVINSLGITTNRDSWSYNFKKAEVELNMQKTVDFFNKQVDEYQSLKSKTNVKDFVNKNPKKISWTSSLIPKVANGKHANYEKDRIFQSQYRPFTTCNLYFGDIVHRRGQFEIFIQYPIKKITQPFLQQELE